MAALEMTALTARVLWSICSRVNPNTNESRVKIREIATELDTAESSVSRAIRELRDRRILQNEEFGVYVISPWIAYCGSAEAWEKATNDIDAPVWSR
jgi:predicted DNA-binding transcriptional regulator